MLLSSVSEQSKVVSLNEAKVNVPDKGLKQLLCEKQQYLFDTDMQHVNQGKTLISDR